MATEQEAIERFQTELADVDTEERRLKAHAVREDEQEWVNRMQQQLEWRRKFAVESLAVLKQQFAEVEKAQRVCANLHKRNDELRGLVSEYKKNGLQEAKQHTQELQKLTADWEKTAKQLKANLRQEMLLELEEVMGALQRTQQVARKEAKTLKQQIQHLNEAREQQRGAIVGTQWAMDEVIMLMDKYKTNNNGADTV